LRKVFLDELPRRGKFINWKESVGYKVRFIYDDIEGEIEIINYYKNNKKKYYFEIKYNNIIHSVNLNSFSKCALGKLFNINIKEYNYNIGDVVTTKTGKIEILEYIRIPDRKSTMKGYKYKCLIDGNIDKISAYNLKSGIGCNVCVNKKVIKGINDIATTHLELIKYFVNIEDAYKYTYGTSVKIEVKCLNCKYTKKIHITSLIKNNGFICPICDDKVSYGNKFIRSFFNQLNEEYIPEYSSKWTNKKLYDIYLPNRKEVWEIHGIQHYEEVWGKIGGRTLKEEQENDKLKKELAENQGLKYIEINARKSELEWIKNSIMSIHEFKRYNLSNINWQKCHEDGCKSLVVEACDLWNKGIRSTIKIGKIMKIDRGTIRKYLKQGNCNYDPYEARLNGSKYSGKLLGDKLKRKVVQLDYDNKFIKEWDSLTDINNELNISISHITSCCRGKQKTLGGFKWMYKEDYDNNKNNIDNLNILPKYKKGVVQLDLNNNFIKEYKTMRQAGKETGTYKENISNCCRKIKNTAGGYKWIYKEDYEYYELNKNKLNNFMDDGKKKIIQLDLDFNFINTYSNGKDASNKTNTNHSYILACCNGDAYTAGGFIWLYENNYNNKDTLSNIVKRYTNKDKDKLIIQLSLNNEFIKEYKNMADAERQTNILNQNISECCRNKRKTAGKFKWMYKEDYDKYIEEQNNIV